MRVIDISANNALFPRNTECEVILRTSKDFTIILNLFPFDKYYWLYIMLKNGFRASFFLRVLHPVYYHVLLSFLHI